MSSSAPGEAPRDLQLTILWSGKDGGGGGVIVVVVVVPGGTF